MWITLEKEPGLRNTQISIVLMVALCFGLWLSVRHEQSRWTNVPPLPSRLSVAASSLSDNSFAYRTIGLMLQNLGDVGGRTTSLHDYDTNRLKDWFLLQNELDPYSNHAPSLAAFYFGGVQKEFAPAKLGPLIDYLEIAGKSPEPGKWRWMAQAVSLARFRAHDYQRAYDLALKLAALANKDPSIPNWARAMPAFVLNQKGDKEGAKMIILGILSSVAKGEITIHPNEVNHMRDVLCNRLMDKKESANDPLCKDIP